MEHSPDLLFVPRRVDRCVIPFAVPEEHARAGDFHLEFVVLTVPPDVVGIKAEGVVGLRIIHGSSHDSSDIVGVIKRSATGVVGKFFHRALCRKEVVHVHAPWNHRDQSARIHGVNRQVGIVKSFERPLEFPGKVYLVARVTGGARLVGRA